MIPLLVASGSYGGEVEYHLDLTARATEQLSVRQLARPESDTVLPQSTRVARGPHERVQFPATIRQSIHEMATDKPRGPANQCTASHGWLRKWGSQSRSATSARRQDSAIGLEKAAVIEVHRRMNGRSHRGRGSLLRPGSPRLEKRAQRALIPRCHRATHSADRGLECRQRGIQ